MGRIKVSRRINAPTVTVGDMAKFVKQGLIPVPIEKKTWFQKLKNKLKNPPVEF